MIQYKGKAWRVIKCPNCGKKFKSEYMKQYHLDNADKLCPMSDKQIIKTIDEMETK